MNIPKRLKKGQAQFLENPNLRQVFDLIETAGGQIRVNGGAVRNALLGEPVEEVDLSTDLLPEQVSKLGEACGLQVVPTGIEHGTVTVISGHQPYEITTLREDIETDGRWATVQFGTDWKADAMRRDFTINALYCDRNGNLYDPLVGFADLAARTVRFIGDPDQRIAEDKLRILRFFRFFAWYGSDRPDPESLKACVRNRDGLQGLSAERIWREFKKLMSAPDPVRSLLWMRTTKILSSIAPETENWGIDLLPSLVAIRQQMDEPIDPLLRLMAIIPPRLDRVDELSARLKLSNDETARLKNWAGLPELAAAMTENELAKIMYRANSRAAQDALWLQMAKQASKEEETSETHKLVNYAKSWVRPELPVQGRDLINLGLPAGPEIGKVLAQLEQAWIDSNFSLNKAELIELAGESSD
ncbi:MAG: CCA tRNA nucleotidyltransferase [Pseudomonadota bacterium]